jgi:hypothetical protein
MCVSFSSFRHRPSFHYFPAIFLAGFLSFSKQRPRVSFSPCAPLGFGLSFLVPSSIHRCLGSVQRAGPESSFGIRFTGRLSAAPPSSWLFLLDLLGPLVFSPPCSSVPLESAAPTSFHSLSALLALFLIDSGTQSSSAEAVPSLREGFCPELMSGSDFFHWCFCCRVTPCARILDSAGQVFYCSREEPSRPICFFSTCGL